jgi:hypothetical protein
MEEHETTFAARFLCFLLYPNSSLAEFFLLTVSIVYL